MIIDFHTHIFPDTLAQRAIQELSQRAKIPPYVDGTADGLRASMQQAGVNYSVLMPIATKPAQAHSINVWAHDINTRYPDLISFGTLHPLMEGWDEEVRWLAEHKFHGVKFHPDYQQFFVDEARLLPLYRALADAGLMVLFHAGIDIGLPPPVGCTPDRLAKVLDAMPNLTIVAAHMGGYQQWDAVEEFLVGRALYLDTCYAYPDLPAERMAAMIQHHGAHHILFGTDSPWREQAAEIETIRQLPLKDEEITAILGENAHRLLYG